MSTVEKFILQYIFVSMIRSTPPQYSILLCLWQQQGHLGKTAFNIVLVKACQIIQFPTRGSLPQQTSHSKGTSFSGHRMKESLSEVRHTGWVNTHPSSSLWQQGQSCEMAAHGNEPWSTTPPTPMGALHPPSKVWNKELGSAGSSQLSWGLLEAGFLLNYQLTPTTTGL